MPTPLALDKAFDIARLFKLEEAGLFDALELTYDDFVAESAVDAHQLWPLLFGQAANHLDETGKAARCTVGLAALNMYCSTSAGCQSNRCILCGWGVPAYAGCNWPRRHFDVRKGFNRGVDVKNPGRTQGMLNEFIWPAYPVPPGNQHAL